MPLNDPWSNYKDATGKSWNDGGNVVFPSIGLQEYNKLKHEYEKMTKQLVGVQKELMTSLTANTTLHNQIDTLQTELQILRDILE